MTRTKAPGKTSPLILHELARAAECRKWATLWNKPGGALWHGSWSAKDWMATARDHIAMAQRLREDAA